MTKRPNLAANVKAAAGEPPILPVARLAFVELYQTAFLQAVRALCCGRDIAITDLADNPLDFRGGGAWPCR